MKFIRNTYREEGSITIATAIALAAVILLNIVLYDFVVFEMNLSRTDAQLKLACNSMLASYDALLAEKYGLYGYNLSSSYLSGRNFDYYYPSIESKVGFLDDFTETSVVKNQILGLMLLKTPANITETVLEAVGVFEESDNVCDAHGECAEASEMLLNMQEITKKLKIIVEGYFDGYVACVNGYTTQVVMDILGTLPDAKDVDLNKVLGGIIVIQEQYYNYNTEAALLFSEQYSIYEKLASKINIAQKDSSSSETAMEISKNAQMLLNKNARKSINNNIDILSKRISILKGFRDSGNINIDDIKNLFNGDKVDSNIRIQDIGTSSLDAKDNRKELMDDILKASNESVFSNSKYEIPKKEYSELPSVVRNGKTEVGVELYNLDDTGFMDSFSSFLGIFDYWDDLSFEKIAKDIAETVLVDDYISSYMTNRLSESSDEKLNNEIEYIIGGEAASENNNNTVEQKIMTLRFVLNFAEIVMDKEKCAVAESMAVALAATISMGAGSTLYKYIILASWALIDSYTDTNSLLKGESVPIVKMKKEDSQINKLQDYGFYLRLLLLFMDEETKLLRISDVIQLNMKEITGEEYKLKGVYSKISVKAVIQFDFIFPIVTGDNNVYKREEKYELSY